MADYSCYENLRYGGPQMDDEDDEDVGFLNSTRFISIFYRNVNEKNAIERRPKCENVSKKHSAKRRPKRVS